MHYIIAIAGCNHPEENLPTVVAITYVPEFVWPIWHAAFEKDDLTGLWWYAPSADATPTIQAAIDKMKDPSMAELISAPGMRENWVVLEKILNDLNLYSDNVIALGREEDE